MSTQSPWTVLGPWAPSQTPEAIRGRYLRSFRVLAILLLPPLALAALVGEIHPRFVQAMDYLALTVARRGWPGWIPELVGFAVPCSLILTVIQAVPAFLVWWEQKIAAHIQVRMGPMRTGLWHGWAQTVADGIKLLLKEDIVPAGADKWIHFFAPVVVAAPAYLAYAPLPFGQGLMAADLDVGLLYVLAISGLSVIGFLMAGWGSNNKYSVLGGLRAAAQVVSYEIPRVIAVLPVVMWAGTLSLSKLAGAQEGFLWGFFPRWFIFYPVVGQVAFIIYLISSVAETNRVPFDIAEAESELVAGYNTEYSGMKFALFFLAEYAYVFLNSALGAVLFLGGGSPILPFLDWIPSYMWFFAKTLFIVFFFIWFRWTYPRMRVDRLMEFCWKFLLPWALANVVLAGALILWRS
ncbi:MAG: NADH-quinone oxidoreductase subunit NuoH [Elusimicrobiota bacterium]